MSITQVDHLTHPDVLLIEKDTREGVIARRNILFGLWAASSLGLGGAAAEAYAWSVHLADCEEPGYDDIIDKVAADLKGNDNAVCERSLRRQLREMQRRSEIQLATMPA
ncbi:ATPase inhibitor subunit zeta [uncultured Methylobacterium sp.]|uniref:ATPase inhibitor subunit zeta n=1 Tax=uncultured Methylobacterium sp. TaxID=157278 RepID=UPI0025915B6C|nr:ATPase inhibitor subunit zeta [uncultured Methylobacterium sp.]